MDPHEDRFVRYVLGRAEGVFDEWGEVTARVWFRAKFKCEYCKESFLKSRQTYATAQLDHILPKSQYPIAAAKEQTNPNVLALACAYCNHIKGSQQLPDLPSNVEELLIKGEWRERLIKRYRDEFIFPNREAKKQQMDAFLEAIKERFPELTEPNRQAH